MKSRRFELMAVSLSYESKKAGDGLLHLTSKTLIRTAKKNIDDSLSGFPIPKLRDSAFF
jgi:hypothetical protein